MEEIWKDIEGYEGLYQVSNLGRVKSLCRKVRTAKGFANKKSKIMKQAYDSKGYLSVNLSKCGKQKAHRVHRLIAIAFITRIEGKDYIDHINGVRDDNRIKNLRWCTHKENNNFPLAKEHCRIAALGNKKWLGKHHTEESKKKISDARKGTKNPHYWENLSDENKLKIKNAAYEANRVEVDQFTLSGTFIKTWESMKVAAESVGAFKSNIFKCCNGSLKTCRGFIWKYHNK